MTDAVEGVARAMFDMMPYDGPEGTTKPAWVENGNSLKQDEARRQAQAAITAHLQWLAENGPDEKMVEAGRKAFEKAYNKSVTCDGIIAIFKAMIEARGG